MKKKSVLFIGCLLAICACIVAIAYQNSRKLNISFNSETQLYITNGRCMERNEVQMRFGYFEVSPEERDLLVGFVKTLRYKESEFLLAAGYGSTGEQLWIKSGDTAYSVHLLKSTWKDELLRYCIVSERTSEGKKADRLFLPKDEALFDEVYQHIKAKEEGIIWVDTIDDLPYLR